MKRVVVTGMGAITPIGLNTEEFWESLKTQKTGFGEITQFDTADFKVKVAASVKGFQGKDYMDVKSARRMELFCQYAVAAAKEALEQSGIDMDAEDPYRVGCAVGSGVGSLQAMERECGAVFAQPRYAADNALGVAILAHRALERGIVT